MIGILLLTHEDLGEHLIRCASHVVGMKPPQLMALGVFMLTYRNEPLAAVIEKGLSGGQRGVVQINAESSHAN